MRGRFVLAMIFGLLIGGLLGVLCIAVGFFF